MRISARTRYALRVLIELGIHQKAGLTVTTTEIATRQRIPRKFLEQILLLLRRANIVRSTRGPHGGYKLLPDVTKLSVRTVVELTETTLFNPRDDEEVPIGVDAIIDVIWQETGDLVRDKLESYSIQDIIHQYQDAQNNPPSYSI